jgi:type I restriction enzyme, S subunit
VGDVLPDGWRETTVGQICQFRNGHGFGPNDWDTQGLPIIRIQNLNGGKEFDYFSRKPEPSWLVEPGQILFSWAGTRGVSFGPCVWQGPLGVLNQHIFKVEPAHGIHKGWLYWVLRHVTNRIEAQAHGFKATLLHVKKSDIERQIVIVPPAPAQRRIAQVLACWDEAIAVTVALLINSRLQKDTLAAVLLSGKRRLLRESDWSKKSLSELIVESRVVGSGGNAARKLTVKLYGRGVVGKSDKRVGSASTNYYRRKAGQFIYSKLDFLNGAFGLVPDGLDGFESTLDLPAFDFIGSVSPSWFLHYVLRRAFYVGHLGLANGGRKARRVNPADLLRLVISTPGFAEQNAIGDALDVAIKDTKNLERQLALLRQQKQALMQQLLTGKRRLRAPESAAETAA